MAVRPRVITITISTAGTPVTVTASEQLVSSVTLVAESTNSGVVRTGDSATDGPSGVGVGLAGGEAIVFDPSEYEGTTEEVDLNEVYVDSSVNGDVISVIYYERTGD